MGAICTEEELESSVAAIKTSEKVMMRFCIRYKKVEQNHKRLAPETQRVPLHFAFPI